MDCWLRKGGRFPASVFGPPLLNSLGSGAQKRPLFFRNWQWLYTFQAHSMWRWCNYLHSSVPRTKKVLSVNIDESSIKLDQDLLHGHVTECARTLAKGKLLRRNIPKGIRRTAYSLVAVMCDDAEIQKCLPQFVVVNKRSCPVAVFRALLDVVPATLKIWRRDSAWLNTKAVCQVVRVVAKVLRKYQTTHQVILSMDACKTHMSRLVWHTAAKEGLLMFGIPALTTGFLQPLDVYAFAQLKNTLRRLCQSYCIDIGVSYCTLGMSIVALMDAIHEVLNGHCWRSSFEHLGLSGHQRTLSQDLLNSLDFEEMPLVAVGFPSLADLTSCFPRGSVIDLDTVFKGVVNLTTVRRPVHAAPLLRSVSHLSVSPDSSAVPSAGLSTIASSVPDSKASGPPPWRMMPTRLRVLRSGVLMHPLPAAPPPLPPPADPPPPVVPMPLH